MKRRFYSLLLLIIGIFLTHSNCQQYENSPLILRASQGVTSTGQPTYFSLSGFNGLELELSLPSKPIFDYTVMFWFRSALSQQDLVRDRNSKHNLFELDGSVQCFIIDGVNLDCNPPASNSTVTVKNATNSTNSINSTKPANTTTVTARNPILLTKIPDIEQWMHLTYTAHATENYSTLRIDYPGGSLETVLGYASISSTTAHLGIDSGLTYGFKGDVREFYMSYGAIKSDKIPNLMNVVKVFDISTMAYYRFQPENGVLNDWMRNQKATLVVAAKRQRQSTDQTSKDEAALYIQPTMKVESATNPFCNTLESQFFSVAKFESFTTGRVPVINAVQDESITFTYTLSMWVHNLGARKYSANSRYGVENSSFFTLEGSFSLWFDSPTSFRVYTYAKDNINTRSSPSCFLPLNQWVNIQVNINSQSGITIMTFNSNGERQQVVTRPGQLAKQVPVPFFNAFTNFNGYILDLIMWQGTQIDIPYQTAQVPDGEVDLISLAALYYNFNQTNYDGSGFRSLAQEKDKPIQVVPNAFSTPTVNSQPVLIASLNSGWNFDTVIVPIPNEVNFKIPSTLGQLSASVNLFDGIGCPEPKNSQFLLKGTPASVLMPVLYPRTNQFTVEFWFRLPKDQVDLPKPNYLFTMGLKQGGATNEAMTIYIDNDGLLKCAPFGLGQAPETILLYEGVYPYQINSWQHVSCIYDRDSTVTGQHLAYNTDQSIGLDSTKAVSRLLTKTFVVSLAYQDQRILNYIQATTMQVILGSNAQTTQAQNCFFKDLRVWVTKRSAYEIFNNRFKQVAQSPDLIVNFKMMDGNPTIKNDADPKTMKATVVGGQYTTADGQNIVCAVDKYFVASAGKCTTFPFSPNIPIVYSVENSVQHGHVMLLTSNYAQSPLTLPNQFQPSFQNHWSSSDNQIDKLLSSHRQASIIEFDPNYMDDGKKFQYTMLATDPVNHNWWQRITETIQPRKCFFIADKDTNQPFNQINYIRRQIKKTEEIAVTNAINAAEGAAILKKTEDPVDLCFAFQVKKVDGCTADYFDILSNKVVIQTQPKIPASILTKAVTGFDPEKKDFNICLDQETLNSAEYPVNVPINFIFYATWTRSGTTESSKMGIVYQVTVNEPITANLTASTPIVDVDQSVLFDARSSKFVESGRTEGLMYRWQCPILFQTYCDDWFGSPVLEFSPAAFLQLGGKIQTPYMFIVQTWSLQSGDRPKQVFSASASVMWKTLQAPKFSIVVTSAPDPTQPILNVTKPNQILIQLSNYRGTDSNLRYTWTLQPQDQFTPELVQLSPDKSVMIIAANALKFKTAYTLTVDIKNDMPAGLTSSQKVTLATQSGPTAGSLSVTPSEGRMLETDFNLQLSGFTSSNPPLSFSLWGITSIEPPRRISLSAGLKPLDSSGNGSVTLNLPFILGLEAEVTDAIGELVKVKSDVKVTQATSTNYTNVVQNINNLADQQTKLSYSQYAAYQIGQDAAANKISQADARSANRQILALLRKSNQSLNKITANDESFQSMEIIASAVQAMTMNNNTLDTDLLDDSITLLEDMMDNQVLFQPLVNQDQEFKYNYAVALANLISYSTISANQLVTDLLRQENQPSKKRLLAAQLNDSALVEIREQIHRAIIQKNRYLDSMCQGLTFNGQEIRINTPGLELIVSKVAIGPSSELKDKQFVHSQDQTTILVPIDEIIRHTLDLDASVSDFCVQVSFMQNNPLSGYNFVGQYPGGKVFAQTSTLDDKGNRILSSQDGITGLQLKPYTIQFPYDFVSQADFKRNQTVCMSFNNNLQVLGSTRWQQNNCRTEIKSNVKKGERTSLNCICSTMSNHYIGLITDKGRDIEIIIPHRFQYEIRLLAVFVPLALLGLCCPCFVMRWDRNDIKAIEQDPYEDIDDTFIDRFRLLRKIECKEEVLYKLPQLKSYEGMKDSDFRVGTCSTLLLYFKALHPLYSLYFHFNFFNKRLLRLSFLIWQVCWITIFALACFLKNTENTPVFQELGDLKLYVIGFLFGLMTLPPPGWVFEFFKIQVAKTAAATVKTNDVSQSKDAEEEDQSLEVVLNDSYMYLKMIFLLATAIVYLITLTILLLFVWYSRTDLSTMENLTLAGYLQFFKMTDIQVTNFIAAWYLAIPGFGWILINGVRIFLIAQLAPSESRAQYEEQLHGKTDGQEEAMPYGIWCCLCKLFSCFWCIITFPFVCVLRCLKCLLSCCHTRCSFCCNCSGLLYLFDYSWRTLIFIPREAVEMGVDVLITIRLRRPGGAENMDKQMEQLKTSKTKKHVNHSYDEEGGYDQEYSNHDAKMARRESSPDILEVAPQPDKSDKKKKKQKKNKKKKKKSRKHEESDEEQN